MTKSQNAKNEQQNDLCITSEQLTKQWKKGELPDGWYYVKDKRDIIRIDYFADVWDYTDVDEVNEVLAEVPSYEEWQTSEKYNKYLEEKIKIYERKDKQATETSIAYNELLEENAILKRLLEECRIAVYDYPPYDSGSDKIRLINKIEEVLK